MSNIIIIKSRLQYVKDISTQENYHIYQFISEPFIWEAKDKFFSFLGKNFLEKLIFYVRISQFFSMYK